MKKFFFVLFILFSTLAQAAQGPYPVGPDQQLTPGTLCEHPDRYRYPEKIAYCERDVKGDLKRDIMKQYDHDLGYSVTKMNRMDFKIDHLIPLCAGGSNERTNLWPQHKSVYNVTDPMEPLICEKMAAGRLKQADAIRMIKEGKLDLAKVPGIIKQLESL